MTGLIMEMLVILVLGSRFLAMLSFCWFITLVMMSFRAKLICYLTRISNIFIVPKMQLPSPGGCVSACAVQSAGLAVRAIYATPRHWNRNWNII